MRRFGRTVGHLGTSLKCSVYDCEGTIDCEGTLPVDRLRWQQLVSRLSPMLVVAWTRAYSVVLPGVMDTFGLSPSQAGRVVAMIEGGSFLSLLVLGVMIDRIGATRVLGIGLPTIAVTLITLTSIQNFGVLSIALVLLGSGMAWAATGVNTLMADTGHRRAIYLGVLHSVFSVFAIVSPIIAGVIVAWDSWQTYYRMVALLALVVAILVCWFERMKPRSHQHVKETCVRTRGKTGDFVKRLFTLCLGVFAIAGVQGIFNTWSYLYVDRMYAVVHERATLAPICFWVGILVGRTSLIGLSRRYAPRTLLIYLSVVPGMALLVEQYCSNYVVALGTILVAGIGLSGTYQLGTAWAAQRTPEQLGAASTAIMAFAWLGIGSWPWAAGVLVERYSYSSLIWIVMSGSVLAASAFLATSSRQ